MTQSRDALSVFIAGAREEGFVTPGAERMRRRIVRIQRERLSEKPERDPGAIESQTLHMRHGAQIETVGVEIVGPPSPGAFDFRAPKARFHDADHPVRDLVLKVEDVRHGAVEPFGPKMRPGFRFEQLRVEPDPGAGVE